MTNITQNTTAFAFTSGIPSIAVAQCDLCIKEEQHQFKEMAECMQETESNVEDKRDDNSTELTPIPSESEFSAVIFNSVPRCYPPDREIECRYTITVRTLEP